MYPEYGIDNKGLHQIQARVDNQIFIASAFMTFKSNVIQPEDIRNDNYYTWGLFSNQFIPNLSPRN